MRILWLTDIHFRCAYEEILKKDTGSKFNKFIKSFIDTINEAQNLDYIIITGDLAFAGEFDDYRVLHETIISKINRHGKIPVITLPGNHDLRWHDNWLKQLGSIQVEDVVEALKNKNKILENPKNNISNHFHDYTNFCKTNYVFSNLHNEFFIEPGYDKSRLFGYFIDAKNRVEFIIINSAWFSLGSEFNKFLLENFSDASIAQIIELKDAFKEYGGQILGTGFLQKIFTHTFLREREEYSTIVMFHHPLNWFEENERYPLPNSEKEDLIINRILNRADILLTGHEHLPDVETPYLIGNEYTWHFEGGKFLQDDVVEGEHEIFTNNRFSILDISDTGVIELRYKYSKGQWISDAGTTKTYAFKRPGKRPYRLTPERYKRLSALFTDMIKAGDKKLFDLLDEKFKTDPQLLEENSLFRAYSVPSKLLVFPLSADFYNAIKNKANIFDNLINEFLKGNGEADLTELEIVTLDLLAKDNVIPEYDVNSKLERDAVFQSIIKHGDWCFDKFRMQFFDRFNVSGKSQLGIAFDSIRGISFINTVISYWKYEKHVLS